MEKLVKIGEIQAETKEIKNRLRKILENAGFVTATYPEDNFEDYLIILEKK